MKKYIIKFTNSAEKELKSLGSAIALDISREIMKLSENPRPDGVKKLKGLKNGLWRIRLADYRIIYKIYENIVTVIVVRVAKREKAYRDLQSL